MPHKRICLYDSSNTPLQVQGIRVELYDASSKAYIDGADSDDLDMAHHPSDTWGVVLNFPSGATPVDVYVSDPTYKYPRNTMRYLNGDLADEVLMDLMGLPANPGGQPPLPSPASVPQINAWVNAATLWNDEEREAVRNLIFNFARGLAPGAEESPSTRFDELKGNWETALKRVGFKPELLEGLKPRVLVGA